MRRIIIEAKCQREPKRGYVYNFWDVLYEHDGEQYLLKEDLTVSQVTEFMDTVKKYIERL